MEFDKEKLEAIPINEVVEAFGGNYKMDKGPGSTKSYNMHCCNGSVHNENDKKPSLTIWPEINACKCQTGCGIKGNPIAVAKIMHNGDYVAACNWLHDTFNIPYKDGTYSSETSKKFSNPKPKKPEYITFDKSKKFQSVKVAEWIKKYDKLSKPQKLKLVYTYLYRFSLTTNRDSLNKYYSSRKITHVHMDKIGYLSVDDAKKVTEELVHHFPIEDLVEFGILNNEEHEYYPLAWRNLKNTLLIPSFSIYSDLVEGFMFRPIDKETNDWFKGKEMRLSIPSIIKPMPFGIGFKLLSSDCDIFITEGHIDAFSLPDDLCFIASPGVDTFETTHLGLLKDKNIKLVFDLDEPGQRKAWGYYKITTEAISMNVLKSHKEDVEAMIRVFKSQDLEIKKLEVDGFRDELLKAGANSVEIVTWNKNLGEDINELLMNGHDVKNVLASFIRK